MAVGLARKGVRVNTLTPGPVQSQMLSKLFTGDQVARRMVHVSIGRFGTPEGMAEGALFLLSDASSYVNDFAPSAEPTSSRLDANQTGTGIPTSVNACAGNLDGSL
jgi:short-subunit dehydrogenase